MNATEIVTALEARSPPKSPEEYLSYAKQRDQLIDAMQDALGRGEQLTERHRSGLERALSHAQAAIRVLELRRDEVVSQREQARAGRQRVSNQLKQGGPVRVDLSA